MAVKTDVARAFRPFAALSPGVDAKSRAPM